MKTVIIVWIIGVISPQVNTKRLTRFLRDNFVPNESCITKKCSTTLFMKFPRCVKIKFPGHRVNYRHNNFNDSLFFEAESACEVKSAACFGVQAVKVPIKHCPNVSKKISSSAILYNKQNLMKRVEMVKTKDKLHMATVHRLKRQVYVSNPAKAGQGNQLLDKKMARRHRSQNRKPNHNKIKADFDKKRRSFSKLRTMRELNVLRQTQPSLSYSYETDPETDSLSSSSSSSSDDSSADDKSKKTDKTEPDTNKDNKKVHYDDYSSSYDIGLLHEVITKQKSDISHVWEGCRQTKNVKFEGFNTEINNPNNTKGSSDSGTGIGCKLSQGKNSTPSRRMIKKGPLRMIKHQLKQSKKKDKVMTRE